MPQDRFVQSNYYNEFFRRITEGYWSAATWITLDRGAGLGLGIGIHRSRRADPEDTAQVEILSSLSPHLRRAGRLHIKLNDVKTRVGQLSDALDHIRQPAILATAEGRLVIANEAASRLVRPDPRPRHRFQRQDRHLLTQGHPGIVGSAGERVPAGDPGRRAAGRATSS